MDGEQQKVAEAGRSGGRIAARPRPRQILKIGPEQSETRAGGSGGDPVEEVNRVRGPGPGELCPGVRRRTWGEWRSGLHPTTISAPPQIGLRSGRRLGSRTCWCRLGI
ncbi:hypothetical protein NDU88_001547 [Pleurodeles waltl]|uniref:Uncharacterized protein n=1 Tax=Pleurodeles waltl TaxID=8319 RepID=A0AAV7L0Z4_PLEWA|nr:hypothetical protein NDU88_001547 [Pleurodeles waltl]